MESAGQGGYQTKKPKESVVVVSSELFDDLSKVKDWIASITWRNDSRSDSDGMVIRVVQVHYVFHTSASSAMTAVNVSMMLASRPKHKGAQSKITYRVSIASGVLMDERNTRKVVCCGYMSMQF